MKKLIVYGNNPQARQFIKELEYFKLDLPAVIAADKQVITSDELFGIKVVEFETVEEKYPPNEYDMVVFGPTSKIRLRKNKYISAKEKGYRLINYISPGAFVHDDVVMGDNVVIFRGADVGFGGVVGSDVIIRNNVYLGHEFVIKDHIIISPGCTIGGACKIGSFCWLGLGATVRDQTVIGDDVLVGMGAVVTKNIESNVTVVGSPAKPVAEHKDGVDLSMQRKGEIY